MKRFRFRLAAVLRLRERAVQAAEHNLAAALADLNAAHAALAAAQAARRRWQEELDRRRRQGGAALDWQQGWDHLVHLWAQEQQAAAAVQRAAEAVALRRQELLAARQRLRAIELLRDRRYAEWRRAAQAAAQRLLDDLAVARYVRRARGS